MSTELEVVSKALVDIDAVSAGIADLRNRFSGAIFEVATATGMDDAKAARLAIRTPRYEVERIRKAAKAPIIALGKKLDAEAARIESELLKIEGPIDQQIKAEEDRKERERQAKIDAELKRVADLQERVAELRGCQILSPTSGAELIAQHIADLERLAVDDSFQEFEQQALDAKEAGLSRLRALFTAAVAHEAEQERIKVEREELAQLRQQREEQEAAAKAARMRIADEAEAARKLVEAEEKRLAAERAELAQQQEQLRKAQEQAPAARVLIDPATEFPLHDYGCTLPRESDFSSTAKPYRGPGELPKAVTRGGIAIQPPSAAEIIDVLAKHYRAHPDTVIDWLRQTDFSQERAA